MKQLIRPAIYGIMAALGIVLIAAGMEVRPTFTWSQVALIVGFELMLVSGHWLIKTAFDMSEDEV